MKVLLYIILFIAFVSVSCFGQLNASALELKDKSPDFYYKCVEFAKEKWGDDHEMVVYTINKQAKAIIEMALILKSTDYDEELMFECFSKWTDLATGLTDYEMLLYTYKKQIKAKYSY